MKKVILSIVILFALSFSGVSQIEPHAIGGRFGGGNYGGGFEINYQHGLSDVNRLELGFGFNSHHSHSYMNLAAVYQWVFQLEEGFNWYVGPGAQFLGLKNSSAIGIGGQLGLEYNFNTNLDTPLLISIDTRPMINFASGGSDFGWAAALGIRYTF